MTYKHFSNKYLGGVYNTVWTNNGPIDEILEFDPVNGMWREVGKMKMARRYHAVSVLEYSASEVERLCNWGVNRYRSRDWLDYICLSITYLWLLYCQNCDSIIHLINTILAKQNFLFQTNQLSYKYWYLDYFLLPAYLSTTRQRIRRMQTNK